jgi:hypothetical protein
MDKPPVVTDKVSRHLDYFTPPQTEYIEGKREEPAPSEIELKTRFEKQLKRQGKTFIGCVFIEPD